MANKNVKLKSGEDILFPQTKISNVLNEDGTPFQTPKSISYVEELPQANESEFNKHQLYQINNKLKFMTIKKQENISVDLVSSLPTESGNSCACSVGSNCYIFSGQRKYSNFAHSRIIKYDTQTNIATDLGEMPRTYIGSCACSVGSNCYIFGGVIGPYAEDLSQDIYKFDTLNNTLSKVGTLPSKLAFSSACSIGNICYIFGGRYYSNTTYYSKIIYKFDTLTNQATQVSGVYLQEDLYYSTACSVGTDCYILGGTEHTYPSADKTINKVYKFDTLKKELKKVGELPSVLTYSTACSVGTDCYLFGGYNGSSNSNAIYKFDTLTNVSSQIVTLPSARSFSSSCSVGTNCFVFGGDTGETLYSKDIIKLNVAPTFTYHYNTITSTEDA